MPNAPPRACVCGRLLRHGSRCAVCTTARDQARGSAVARGYDQAWARFSAAWLREFPWCGQRQDGQLHADHSRCVQAGRRTGATCTDHIVRLRDGGSHRDRANSQSLCTSCNVAKDARDRRGA